jgi:hypothetical protein
VPVNRNKNGLAASYVEIPELQPLQHAHFKNHVS